MPLATQHQTSGMEVLSRKISEEVLRRNEIGRLGCFSPKAGQSYIVPISYRFHRGSIYFACMPGQKLEYIKEHPTGVCLEVEEVNDAHQWLTVIATGTVTDASGWEQVEQGFPTIQRVTRGPLRSQFSASSRPNSMGELVMCVLHPTIISGRKDRWVFMPPPQSGAVEVHSLAGMTAG